MRVERDENGKRVFTDNFGRDLGDPDFTLDPEVVARGIQLHERLTGTPYPGVNPHGSTGANTHHGVFRRICVDQNLYRAGLITATQCHPDCDLSTLPGQLSQARDFLSLAGVAIDRDMQPLQVMARAYSSSDFAE